MAQLQGLRVIKIPEMGRWIGAGAFKPIAGWSDFMLIHPDGRTAFIDTKTTASDRFAYSAINFDQIKFFSKVGDLLPAGYVVYFRETNAVVLLPWTQLNGLRPGESLSCVDGRSLGHLTNFSVAKIFS